MGKSNNKKPKMPQTMPQTAVKRSGLGRGLASLIPSGDNRPSLGAGAADVILGGSHSPTTAGSGSKANESPTSINSSKGSRTINGANHSEVAQKANTGSIRRNEDKPQSGANNRNRHRDVNDVYTGSGRHEVIGAEKSESEQIGTRVTDGSSPDTFGAEYRELSIDSIRTNAKQPRQVFDEEALNELVHSIREFGLMQPIVVREASSADTDYELIMGERRLRAAKKAGLSVIPAIVRETEDNAMLRDALLENIHRVQLNPLEEAAAYQQLLDEFGVTQGQLAEKIGRSRPLITNMIRLLQLPVAVQRRVGAGVLSAGHARALLGVRAPVEIADDEAKAFIRRVQDQIADRIVAEGLSVRATEEAVTLFNRGDAGKKKPAGKTPKELSPEVSQWVDDISDALDTKVSVQMGKKRGKIVVEFGGPEDFDRITELLRYKS